MSEASNLTAIDGGKPKIVVRMPNFRDGSNFVGALAAGEVTGVLDALDGGHNTAALLIAVKSALRSPAARDEMLSVMADLWVYEPSSATLEAPEPPEEWEYDPPSDMVTKGQAVGRDERWRSLSARQKKRIVKKLELETYPVTLAGEFVEAFKQLPYVQDFLDSLPKSTPAEDGSSSTPSPADTDGASSE